MTKMYSIVVLLALASCVHSFNHEVDEKFHKLPHDEFIKYFNSQNFTWKIQKYDNLDEKVLDCVEVSNLSIPIKPAQKYEDYAPTEFDGNLKWPKCRVNIDLDQGKCGSCWAVTVSAVASVRFCIFDPFFPHRPSKPPLIYAPFMSAKDLTCCKDCFSKNFCSGGSPERAALFWIKNGLVTQDCKPNNDYANETTCKEECVDDNLFYNADKYFGEFMYLMPVDDHEIRHELATDGPLIASFALHEDFKDYKSGIYEHTHGKLIGHHSVEVFGYGVENEVPYWLVSNTWGKEWGTNGTFKIKRFQEKLGFENRMISIYPRFRIHP